MRDGWGHAIFEDHEENYHRGRDRRKATPFAANDFLKAMRSLFKWAKDSDFIEVDPTEGVEGLGHKTEGFHVWTDDEIAKFEVRWPIGTRERLALTILLYTGLRRGDEHSSRAHGNFKKRTHRP